MFRPLLAVCAVVLSSAACSVPPPPPESSSAAPVPRAWSCSPRVELSSVWSFLSEKYDADSDGRITPAEYPRGQTRFANYDRDANGVLDASDFPPDTFFNGFNHMVVMHADRDDDRQVTWAEWQAFGASLDENGDGEMASDEIGAVLGGWTSDWRLFLLSFDQDGDGEFDATDLAVTFRDQDFDGDGVLAGRETAGWQPTGARPEREPPSVGEPAPDFELAFAAEPGRVFRLSNQVREQPIALVFGSYT